MIYVMTISLNDRIIENGALERMWKEPADGLFEALQRNLNDFTYLSHRKHRDLFFYKDPRINAAK
jgi:hypothetical protein